MAKMTKEEKAAKAAEKKAAQKAKREGKRLARLEKKRLRAEKKRAKLEAKRAKALAKREAKKAKKLARLEKEKAKKLKLKEKKRLAKEKQAALKKAKTIKIIDKKPTNDAIDIREAAKNMKCALAQLATELSQYSVDKRAKKTKSISGMGYVVETKDGNVIVRFAIEKSKKDKFETAPIVGSDTPDTDCAKTVAEDDANSLTEDNAVQEVEIVPAGDIYGQNGNVDGEVANIDSDDDSDENDEDDENIDDDSIFDSRDEQDEDLIDNRREFFNSFGEDFEPNDD